MMRNSLFSVLLAVMAAAGASAVDCDQANSPTFVETKGNEDYPFIFEHVEILSHDSDSVSFSVSQNWMKEGTPMFAVQYESQLDQVCDMQADKDSLVDFGSSKTYTAQCSEGRAEVGIFFYVGDNEAFSADEVEACSAPDTNYVAHYMTIPCNYESDCYDLPIVQSERSLVESCTCEAGDENIMSWKCGSSVFFCPDMTQICANTGTGGSMYYELTDEQCDTMKSREIGEACVTLPQYGINNVQGIGLSHRVCYDGTNNPMKNDGSCATCNGFKDVVAEPTKVPCPTNPPVSTPTEDPTTSPSESPTAAPTETPTDSPTETPTDSPSGSPTEPVDRVLPPVDTDCASSFQALLAETQGDSDTFGDVESPITIITQDIDEVTFEVHQVFSDSGVGMFAVSYRETEEGSLMCDMQSGNVLSGTTTTYTAQCIAGYAMINLYLYTGPAASYDEAECEACKLTNPETEVAYQYVVPCTPLCKPAIPDCLEGPLVTLADIDEEEVCVYADMPVVLDESSMDSASIAFEVDNKWPDNKVTSVSVSYVDADSGEATCGIYPVSGDSFKITDTINAFCQDGLTTIVVNAHSADITYEANMIDNSCTNPEGVGTCSYEMVLPCDPNMVCAETPVSESPTESPTFFPTQVPSDMPSDMPSDIPSGSPTTSPSSSPTDSPSGSPTKDPTATPTSSPTTSPSGSPTATPSSTPTTSPSSSPTPVPTTSPSAGPSGSYYPSSAPSDAPTKSAEPSSSPTTSPSSSPTDSPTTSPSESPTTSPSATPTAYPTESMNPTDCSESMDPEINGVCYEGGNQMETPLTMPEGAVVINSESGDSVEFTVTNKFTDAVSIAVNVEGVAGTSCDLNDDLTTSYEAQCMHGYTTATIVVHYAEVDKECDACNVLELTNGIGNFCAYSIVIPCESAMPVECGEPSSAPSSSPTSSPTTSPSTSPTTSPSSNPTAAPTTSPSGSPSASPSSSPTTSPSAGPSATPSSSPTTSPSGSPSATPTTSPTTSPSAGPTATPTSSPTTSPSASPTAYPTESAQPTDCTGMAEPQIEAVCYAEGAVTDMVPLPADAIVISGSGESVSVSIQDEWANAKAITIKHITPTFDTSCSIHSDVTAGPWDVEAYCTSSVTTVVVIAYLGDDFNEEDCLACDVEDHATMGGTFCAYSLAIRCDETSVDCGEPSASPSGSFYPSQAPSESPTTSASPSASPTTSPSSSPTGSPSGSPTEDPTATPTTSPSESPSAGPTATPTSSPTTSPSAGPTATPTSSPTTSPSAGPTATPTSTPTTSPSAGPTATPSSSPTTSPSGSPSATPSSSPTTSPSGSPSATPTTSPSAGPTATPTSSPTTSPSASPTAYPTESAQPTDCTGMAEPQIEAVCYADGAVTDMVPLPADAIVISGSGESVSVSIQDEWADAKAITIKHVNPDLDTSCSIYSDVAAGPWDVEAYCTSSVTTVVVIAYLGEDFNEEDCLACQVEDHSAMGGTFCAYSLAIPCDETSVDCGEPSASPSGSFYPSQAPSESPTTSASPSASPTTSPSSSPTDSPSGSPTVDPTATPTTSPSESPSAGPTATPTSSPTASPSGSPSASPSAGPTATPTSTPTTSPSGSPSASPTTSPSAGPTATPSSSPTTSPSGSPSATPSSSPTTSPSAGPTATPTSSPTTSPSASPTAYPTESAQPTDCTGMAEPQIEAVCYAEGAVTDMVPLPADAIVISGSGESVSVTIQDEWADAKAITIKHVNPDLDTSCSIYSDVAAGPWDVEAYCTSSATTVVVIAYLGDDFNEEDCLACQVEDPSTMGGTFCAYSIEIPCDEKSVDCGEPSASPSGSFYPSEAPSEAPTKSASPSSAPTGSPSDVPTSSPSSSPSAVPTSSPSESPSASPTTASPSAAPTDSCPERTAILVANEGDTMYEDMPVKITMQNVTHVGFQVINTFGEPVSSFFTQYHAGDFGETECDQEENIEIDAPIEYVAQCMHATKISIMNLWVQDCTAEERDSFLDLLDDAEVPECCHPGEVCKTVQYTFKIPCVDPCPPEGGTTDDNTGRRLEESIRQQKADEESTMQFEELTGQADPDGTEDHFCVVEDYPCGANLDKVHVCHYSARDGYKTFCVPEADSDALRFYPKDYCGPCVGGYSTA